MKSLWRKIGFISAWVIFVLGTVGAIVGAAMNGNAGFIIFCAFFVPALFFFTILMAYLEHTNNMEMRADQTYRKQNNLPQLPENAYTNLPFTSAPSVPAAYQQPVQPQYQQPVQFQQPAPVAQPTPAPAPVPQPAPEAQGWICTKCGTSNNAGANFCKGCGNKKD